MKVQDFNCINQQSVHLGTVASGYSLEDATDLEIYIIAGVFIGQSSSQK